MEVNGLLPTRLSRTGDQFETAKFSGGTRVPRVVARVSPAIEADTL